MTEAVSLTKAWHHIIEHGQMMLVAAKDEDWETLLKLSNEWHVMLDAFFEREDAKLLPNLQLELEKIMELQREIMSLSKQESELLNIQTALFNRGRQACRTYSNL